MPRSRARLVSSALACAAAAIVAFPSRGEEGPRTAIAVPAERLDDAPATVLPRNEPEARSTGLRLPFGSYVSVQVNVSALGQNIVGDAANEPSIAVNPLNPNNMVIGWRQFDTTASNFRQAGRAYTMDGGQTWTFPGVFTPGVFRSDPVLDTDSSGNFYYQSLKSDFFMDVFKSTDGGVTWGPPVASYGGDKNWMVVDKSDSIGNGHVYGFWREAFGCCGANVFTRSANGGANFEPPVPAAPSPGLGTMAVGPDGAVYVTGIDELHSGLAAFVAVRSPEARNAADPTPAFISANVAMGGSLVFGGPPNPGGLVGQANIAVDRSLALTRGFVYLLSTVDPIPAYGQQPAAVLISRSEDGGVSWNAPVRVNDDPTNNGAWHWFGAHAVAPNGRIDAIWNDTRDTGSDVVSQLYYAYSYDAGQSWSDNVAVSPSFNSTVGWPNQSKIGDYYTIVSDSAGGHVAYAATFNGEQDVYYVRVFPDCNGNGVSDVEDTAGTSPDCNGNFIPDECEESTGCFASGVVPDGTRVQDTPLLLSQAAGDAIELTWHRSCKSADNDYEIYEGEIGGDFSNHAAKLCTTGGAKTAEIVPEAGDRYFLVVPRNGSHEGSYGKTSAGQQRPAGSGECPSQLIGVCLLGGG